MAAGLEVVTYDGLPASAGGAHTLRSKHPRTAYDQVEGFLDAAVRVEGTPTLAFRLWSGGPSGSAAGLEEFAAARLGGPQRRQRTHADWRVRAEDVDAVLDALIVAGPAAVTTHGHPLASLVWSAAVAVLDPDTRRPYAELTPESFGDFAVDGYGRRLGASGVQATIGTTASSLSLWLAFPGDERLRPAAAHVQQHLPFRMSAKHWRRWTATKDGTSYRSSRIESPLVAGPQ